MKIRFMLVLILISVLGSYVTGTEYPAELQGYVEINRTLQDRLFSGDAPNPFTLGRYIGGNNIGKLMGYYQGNGLTSGFYNGQPNATNMLLWFVAFDGLSKDLSKICDPEPVAPEPPAGENTPQPGASPNPSPTPPPKSARQQLNDFYRAKLLALCQWPDPASRNEAVLKNLWEATMSFDAPQSEFEIWRDFILSDDFSQSTPPEAIKASLKTVFLNPYFLLRP